MIIQCDQCDRKFRVDDAKIKPPGSRVRCSKCGNVFFVEKKETAKSPEKSAEAPPSNLDNLQIDTEAKIGQEKGHLDEVAKEAPKQQISVRVDTQPDSDKSEKVWSIEQDDDYPGPDLAKPSIEVDIKSQDRTEDQPAKEDIGLQTDSEESQGDSSISWASLDTEDKDQPTNKQPPDDDLTPPVQAEPSAENKELETQHTEPEVSQTAAQSSATDITEPPTEGPNLCFRQGHLAV